MLSSTAAALLFTAGRVARQMETARSREPISRPEGSFPSGSSNVQKWGSLLPTLPGQSDDAVVGPSSPGAVIEVVKLVINMKFKSNELE